VAEGRDAVDTLSSGELFQTFEAATRNALLSTVCKQTEDTARQSVTAERSARRLYVRNMNEWRKIMRRSIVESLVHQHGHLVLDAPWNSQPMEADESLGDVTTEPR